MEAVGHEGGRADLRPDADPVDGDQFVAGETDDPGDDDPAHVPDVLGMHEAVHGLPAGHRGGQGDHGHDEDAGQVLGPAVAVGVAPVGRRRPTRRRGQGHGGEGVGEVVDGVGEQGDRAADQDDEHLEGGRDGQAGE